MAVRIRCDGRVLCAAMHPEMLGDTYIDDGLAYELSVVRKVLVTEPMLLDADVGLGGHARHGEWWWIGNVPERAAVDPFYLSA
jgi:hypothetical protein